jgi:hypothetical protein
LLITLREHLCSPPVFDGVRCCSLLFTSTCVHLRFLMGSGVAHLFSFLCCACFCLFVVIMFVSVLCLVARLLVLVLFQYIRVLNFIQNDKRRRVLLQKSQHLQISYKKMCFYIVTSINGRGTIMSIPRTTSQFHGCDSILNPMRPYTHLSKNL